MSEENVFLNLLADVLGWSYFLCWALVCYPQIILNYKLQSVEGFKLDYPFLNFFGFVFFAISYSFAYFGKLEMNNYGFGKIEPSDLVFALHGVFVNTILNYQSIFYKKGNNRIHPLTIAFMGFSWVFLIFFYFASEHSTIIHKSEKFNILQLLGNVKVFITSIKYAFLVHWNWSRKSTKGFSGVAFIFDFAGSILSLSNTLLLYNIGRTNVINIPKLALSCVVIFYNIVLLYQAFVLYPRDKEENRSLLINDEQFSNQEQNSQYVKFGSETESNLNL